MSTNEGVFSRRLNLRELGPLAAHMHWFVCVWVSEWVCVCVWEWVCECVRVRVSVWVCACESECVRVRVSVWEGVWEWVMSTNESVFSRRLNLRELGPLAAHMRWFVCVSEWGVCVCESVWNEH